MNGLNIGRRLVVIALAIAVAVLLVLTLSPIGSSSQPFDGMQTNHKPPKTPGPTAPACGLVGKYKKHPTPTCTK